MSSTDVINFWLHSMSVPRMQVFCGKILPEGTLIIFAENLITVRKVRGSITFRVGKGIYEIPRYATNDVLVINY
jgi:hypothetical protein